MLCFNFLNFWYELKLWSITMKIFRQIYLMFFVVTFVVTLTSSGCNEHEDNPVIPTNDKGEFTLNSKYKTIRSFPEGGGIFIISISPGTDFAGTVKLSVSTESGITAKLNKTELTDKDSVADIIISTSENAHLDTNTIIVRATHNGKEKELKLNVDVLSWMNESSENAVLKRDEFRSWFTGKSAKYSEIFSSNFTEYQTYPQILIVEHHTFITKSYEVRICYHVMIPPDDWSKLLIRNRNFLEPEIALKRETDGSIHEIPIEEYPTFDGY